MQTKISASILSCDFSKLYDEIKKLEDSKIDMIHFDIMDGIFVPNITFGAPIIKNLRKITNITFDTHLMIDKPERYVDHFIEAGSDIITFHVESTVHIDRLIKYIKSKGIKVGIALVPSTNENNIEYLMDIIDMVLVMTVNPGFSGQNFLESQLVKIQNIRNMINKIGRNIDLQVDGGIDNTTSTKVRKCGANILVSGSYIFATDNYKNNIANLIK